MPRPALFLDVDGVLCTPLSVRLDQVFRRPMVRRTTWLRTGLFY